MLLIGVLVLWRLPPAASLRPEATFGASLEELIVAWLPEAIAIGIAAMAFQRFAVLETPPQHVLRGMLRSLLAMTIWLAVWTHVYLVPGWLVLGPLASDIEPFVENFSLASIAWLVNVWMAMLIGLLYSPLVVVSSIAGAMLAAALLPAWQNLAGATARYPARFWGRFWHVVATGALFWIWRGLAIGIISSEALRSAADAVVITMLLWRFVVGRRQRTSGPA